MKNKNGGFVKIILFVIFVIFLLSYLNIDLRGIVEDARETPEFEEISEIAEKIWSEHLSKPIADIWDTVFINLFLNTIIEKYAPDQESQQV
jgi:hypothetical protein